MAMSLKSQTTLHFLGANLCLEIQGKKNMSIELRKKLSRGESGLME